MAATNIYFKTSKNFIDQLRRDFPQLTFKPGSQDHWSPKTNTVSYKSGAPLKETQCGVLHELAHAKLGHSNYHSDFELLKLEGLAWELAAKIGKKYGVKISDDHIQNCLDTYRDWLHARSRCPACGVHVLQKDPYHYHCFNCHTEWKVTSGRFVRPYRLKLS
ncbi:hypothetical protein HY379_02845 [Candidatus Saccharibacteria bacterium]|nr:hypothetical protein [Candidatus Saccharibacteria bacterium]